MKNSEKEKFENAWQKAFDNAEQSPSEDVWAGIEHALNKVETVTMKRRVLFYQRLAAASIVFALLLAGLSTYYVTNQSGQQSFNLSQHPEPVLSDDKSSDNSNASVENGKPDDLITQKTELGIESTRTNNNEGITTNKFNSQALIAHAESQELLKDDKPITMMMVDQQRDEKRPMGHNYSSPVNEFPEPVFELSGELREVTIVRKLPAMPSSFMASNKNDPSSESLWTSLGASTGNYSPSPDLGSSNTSQVFQNSGGISNNRNAYSTSSSKGSVFSVGVNVGKRLSRRWLLQGGVSYLNQAMGYTSNYAVLDANNNALASVAEFSNKSYASVVPVSSPYEINSVNEFIALPVQAGYLLVDKKFGLQLNSGISTDFFMQNTLTDKSGQLATATSGTGDESPFRTVSWAGLMGTELSYRIATQYRVSIAPGLRYSLNSVLKSGTAPSNPIAWDVGFRFRYIIK